MAGYKRSIMISIAFSYQQEGVRKFNEAMLKLQQKGKLSMNTLKEKCFRFIIRLRLYKVIQVFVTILFLLKRPRIHIIVN